MFFAKYLPFDTMNGEGVRCTLFVSGCTLNCEGCHNKEAQNFRFGEEFTEHHAKQILTDLNNPFIKGLSLTGGDPLEPKNYPTIINLCQAVRMMFGKDKDIWLWTGRTMEEVKQKCPDILDYIDVLIDGRFELDKKDESLEWCGSKNQKIWRINVE